MEIGKLKEIFKDFKSDVKFEHDLRKKNWFNIGGKSKIFYQANTLKDLIYFLKKLDNKEKILSDDDIHYSNKMAFYKILITTQQRMNKTTDKYLSEVANSWLAKQQREDVNKITIKNLKEFLQE